MGDNFDPPIVKFKNKAMTQIKEDEEYFELINDFPSSDLAIVHDLTLAIMKIRGVYHPDYRGYRDACYLENFQEASRTFKKLKLNIKFPYNEYKIN